MTDHLNRFQDFAVVEGMLSERSPRLMWAQFPSDVALNEHTHHPIERTYPYFMCAAGNGEGADGSDENWWRHAIGDPPDGDINLDLRVDSDYLERDGFWDPTRWLPGHDPESFRAMIRDATSGGYHDVHTELIMYGRDGDRDHCERTTRPLLPGWADLGASSILLNGRPMNGCLAQAGEFSNVILRDAGCEGIQEDDNVSCEVARILNSDVAPLSQPLNERYRISEGSRLRISGFVTVDEHKTPEIHPVTAIDVVNPIARDDLTGTWDVNPDGGTAYLREIAAPAGVIVVWGLAISRDRGMSYLTVFRGVKGSDGGIVGEWKDLPMGGRMSAGSGLLFSVWKQWQLVGGGGGLPSLVSLDKMYEP